jgi:hypothetical protein
MALAGADRLVRALQAVEDEATDKAVHLAAAETVAEGARGFAPVKSGAAKRSTRASATKGSGVVRAGGPRLPWVPPAHFGAPPPRPQGGYMRPNPWLYKGGDARADEVLDLFQRKLDTALRRQGLT